MMGGSDAMESPTGACAAAHANALLCASANEDADADAEAEAEAEADAGDESPETGNVAGDAEDGVASSGRAGVPDASALSAAPPEVACDNAEAEETA